MVDEAHARSMNALHDGDPETSHEAAAKVDVTTTQQRVVEILRQLTLATDEQIYRQYKKVYGGNKAERLPTEQSVRSRRSELTEGSRSTRTTKVIQFSGKFGNTSNGNRSRLWELKP
jgi:hypothetical protein